MKDLRTGNGYREEAKTKPVEEIKQSDTPKKLAEEVKKLPKADETKYEELNKTPLMSSKLGFKRKIKKMEMYNDTMEIPSEKVGVVNIPTSNFAAKQPINRMDKSTFHSQSMSKSGTTAKKSVSNSQLPGT